MQQTGLSGISMTVMLVYCIVCCAVALHLHICTKSALSIRRVQQQNREPALQLSCTFWNEWHGSEGAIAAPLKWIAGCCSLRSCPVSTGGSNGPWVLTAACPFSIKENSRLRQAYMIHWPCNTLHTYESMLEGLETNMGAFSICIYSDIAVMASTSNRWFQRWFSALVLVRHT